MKSKKFTDLVQRQPMDANELEESIEMQWVFKELYESDKEYADLKKLEQERRIMTHQKITKSNAFK